MERLLEVGYRNQHPKFGWYEVIEKVDNTHYTLNLTTFAAQQQSAVIDVNATVNGQAMRPGTVTYTAPMRAGTDEGYALTFSSAGDDGSTKMNLVFHQDDVDDETSLTGTYSITFNAGSYNGINYSSATITVNVIKGA